MSQVERPELAANRLDPGSRGRQKQYGVIDDVCIMKLPSVASTKVDFQVAKLERETLHDRAYLELKKAIMSGAIRPGATITIRAMAAALGTSPMPVREALRRLVAERALEMLPTRSVTLPLMTAEQFDEICRIRVAVEGLVTETAATLITPEELRRMQQIHAEMSRLKSEKTASYLVKNQELHFTLYQASRMPVALQMIESLWLQAGPLLNLALSELGLRAGQDHHRELIAALSKRSVASSLIRRSKRRRAFGLDLASPRCVSNGTVRGERSGRQAAGGRPCRSAFAAGCRRR